ncbi:family 20 glycosylhydrolase [Xylanimonas ulmi]|uniref:beta-N-acetylhexosaminidase n=1 Tax=Xylanimonas ulmi TaxID=228973 RepID=A0A4V2EY24_9MICO|nr:family 20 glycosylhydrolase [Xylanibacterium ulmi]RZS61500.1 hexosaminidase [Xylanibacterium ulmi]
MNDHPRSRLRPRVAGLILSTLALGTALGAGAPPAAAAPESRDVARTAVASAASVYPDARFAVEHVNDGDPATRWGSKYTRTTPPVMRYDPTKEWVQLALAEPTYILKVVLDWEAAYPTEYDLQASKDGVEWTSLATKSTPVGAAADGHVLHELFVDTSEAYAFVRVQASATATRYGLSLYRFEVWDTPATSDDAQTAPTGTTEPGATGGTTTPTGPTGPSTPTTSTTPAPLVPAPVTQRALPGEPFRLTADSRVVAQAHREVAEALAAQLRPATGFALPVATGEPTAADVAIRAGDPVDGAAAGYAADESYRLTASAAGVEIAASTGHGAFNATRTLLQSLPVWVEADTPAHVVDWAVAPTAIADYPRFAARGLAVDPARNFVDVPSVKAIIDEMAAVKLNRLHLHLTDDQGWRLRIDSWPRLTEHGASSSMRGGISGFYTQADFAEIVRYAADRFVEVVPEIDMPGHSDAALSSYPELHCEGADIPIRVTGGISHNSLCVTSERTYEFIDDVLREVAAISPSEYIHIGADEPEGVTDAQYGDFVRRVEQIAAKHGKKIIGWTPLPGAKPSADAVHQYWADRKNHMSKAWFEGDRKVILSPTERAYLDYRFAAGQRLGFRDPIFTTRRSYDWDPTSVVDQTTRKNLSAAFGLAERNVLGIEGAIWGETMLRGRPDIEYMIWPRLAGLADKGWAPRQQTSSFTAFAARLASLGARLQVAGTNFWADPEVPWAPAVAGLRVEATAEGFDGPVATIAAPGVDVATVTATVRWSDGSTSEGVVTGTNAVDSRAASLFTVSARHDAAPGDLTGSVEVRIRGRAPVTVPFAALAATGTTPVAPEPEPVAPTPEPTPVTPEPEPEPEPSGAPGAASPSPDVTPSPGVSPSPTTAAPAAPATSSAPVAVLVDGKSPATLTAGGEHRVTVTGLAPHTTASLDLRTASVRLAAGQTDADGALTAVVRIPAGTAAGKNELRVLGTEARGAAVDEARPVTVQASASASAARLASTGGAPTGLVIAAGALLVAGAALTLVARARRARATAGR